MIDVSELREFQKGFTTIDNTFSYEKNMSLKAKGLLVTLFVLANNKDWDYSIKGLAKLSKDGERSVRSALEELEEFGYLTRVRTREKNGQFTSINYIAHRVPVKEAKQEQPKKIRPEKTKAEIIKEIKQELSKSYNDTIVNYYINKAKKYKNCLNINKILDWIEQDKENKIGLFDNSNSNTTNKSNKFNDFEQRKYSKQDFVDLEKRLLGL